ncbi:MAG TPA: hypothetical protein PLB12_05635 [Candidatus Goldiibacteriota bacterium]|nr:hypothetical protein [Candidatus Goldiibacteriota bacterium]HPI04248.1 hypothetical protein [Candidatus Goldiibacteriota bacterium]HPN64759.1 hypothetical protein [Candidatus Goldiibacteriota bacterium]HRQ43816.1 hypothetical protein [Candidatus Goldiibacteriota bacterium]
MENKVIYAIASYAVVIITGFVLSKYGKPFNTLVLTAHKLLALAAVVFMVIVIREHWAVFKGDMVSVTAAVFTGIFVTAMFATGAMLSFEKPAAKIVIAVHKALPYMILVTGAAVIYLLKKHG